MNMASRFGQQYQENLREYRRQTPWRFLRLLIAFVLAIAIGGLLHLTKNIPVLFYPLVAVLVIVGAIFFVMKMVRLFGSAVDQTRFIVNGNEQQPPGHPQMANVNSSSPSPDPNELRWSSTPIGPQPNMPVPSSNPQQGGSGIAWLIAGGLICVLFCSGCLVVPLLFLVGARQPAPQNAARPAGFPIPPDPTRPFQDRIQQQHQQMRKQQEDMQRRNDQLRKDIEKRFSPNSDG